MTPLIAPTFYTLRFTGGAMSKTTDINNLSLKLKAGLRSRSRTSFVPFLEKVYAEYASWRSDRCALVSSEKIAAEYELPVRADSHAVRILIEACRKQVGSDIHERTLSEWTMCVRKAWRRRDKWQDFSDFLTDNGGISGVAALPPKLPRYRRSDA
jgi:hypothetical protein